MLPASRCLLLQAPADRLSAVSRERILSYKGLKVVAIEMNAGELTVMLTTLIAALTTAVVSVIGALKAKDIQKSVETSNGKTIARMIEDNHATIENKVVPVAEKADAVVDEQIRILSKVESVDSKVNSILGEQDRTKEELSEYKRNHDQH